MNNKTLTKFSQPEEIATRD